MATAQAAGVPAGAERERLFSHSFLFATGLYIALAAYFLREFRFAVNTDATSYISIAQKYCNGEFLAAVNAIWQPLFSWMIAPFICFGVEPLLSAKLVQIIGGMVILAACRSLSLRFAMRKVEHDILMITLVPVALQFTFFTLTPDLLLAGIMLLYFSVILDPGYPSGRFQPAVCGLLGGLAFLSKAYALPFFIVHFSAMSIFYGRQSNNWKESVRRMTAGFAVFFLIIAAWSAALSLKYGRFTVNAAFGFNVSASLSGDWPIPVQFRRPVNPSAVSVWEDPSMISFEKPRLDMKTFFKKEAKKVWNNFLDALGIINRFSPLAFVALIFALAASLMPGSMREKPSLVTLLASAAILVAGYLPVNLETRYIWASLILLVIISFILLSRLFRLTQLPVSQQHVLLLLVCASFIAGPLLRMDNGKAKPGALLHQKSEILSSLGVKGRIASDSNWEDSLYLVFFLKAQYYGVQEPGLAYDELRAQLEALGIQYYFWWREGPVPDFLNNVPEVVQGRFKGLRVYRLQAG